MRAIISVNIAILVVVVVVVVIMMIIIVSIIAISVAIIVLIIVVIIVVAVTIAFIIRGLRCSPGGRSVATKLRHSSSRGQLDANGIEEGRNGPNPVASWRASSRRSWT